MTDYEVGYGKPPKHTRFQRGVSGNVKGRPKGTPDALGAAVQGVLGARVRYREKGRSKTATRDALRLKVMVEKALRGDVRAAEAILKERNQAARQGVPETRRLVVTGWLPDYPGETADQKTAALAAGQAAFRRRSDSNRGRRQAGPGACPGAAPKREG